MGWFDDAKDKAEEAAEDAKQKAAREAGKAAGKAAVSAASTAARKSVGALFEGIISSAEASLESAQAERGHTGEENQVLEELEATLDDEGRADGEPDTTDEPDRPQRSGPTLEERLAAMRAEQATVDPEPVVPVPQQTNVAPESLGPVRATPSDPMAKAIAALEAARRARGVDIDTVPDPPPVPTFSGPPDPLAAVDEALAKAAAARQHARSGGRAAQEREEAARAQLAALKSGSTPLREPVKHHEESDVSTPDDDVPSSGPAPKKRSL